jgi:YbgC/YbaW family acyl-CoA thioester hydrolase
MAHEFRLERRVEFADTDMAGIVHFSNFFRYMEETEHEFFRSLGLTVHSDGAERMTGWARVEADCRYMHPLHYPDRFEVRLVVRDKSARSLAMEYEFHLLEKPEVGPVARGRLEIVHVVQTPEDERIRGADMPAEVAAKIEVAPTDSEE